MTASEDILSMEEDDNSVRRMSELVGMFLELHLSNIYNICNSVLCTLNNNRKRLVFFCSKLKDKEFIKTHMTNETLKYITTCGFKMGSYVSEDDVSV